MLKTQTSVSRNQDGFALAESRTRKSSTIAPLQYINNGIQRARTSAKACNKYVNWKILIIFLLYPYGDPDHSRNLIGCKLDQDPSSQLFLGRFNQQYLHYPAHNKKKTNGQTVMKIIPPWWWQEFHAEFSSTVKMFCRIFGKKKLLSLHTWGRIHKRS